MTSVRFRLACTLSVVLLRLSAAGTAHAALGREVYVWQRDWTEDVREAIRTHSAVFTGLVALNAEVSWNSGHPTVMRVPVDYCTWKAAACPVGLALRIGPFPGPFHMDDEPARFLGDLAASLVREARERELGVSELQIDFDCTDSKLAGYWTWIEAIRKRASPVPVTITVLPSWLNQPAFGALALAAPNYVLQVHSLHRPKNPEAPFTLCDPTEARQAVERAAALGVPFRVALPTYGYTVAFDRSGKFIGLSADGSSPAWPDAARLREVRADPEALSLLVRHWSTNHPAALRGLIWYRLPIDHEHLNWAWPTLAAVLEGQAPKHSWRIEKARPKPGLVELSVHNNGEADQTAVPSLVVRWKGGKLISADALQGFELTPAGPTAVRFFPQRTTPSGPIRPGQDRTIGWVRLAQDQEVEVELSN